MKILSFFICILVFVSCTPNQKKESEKQIIKEEPDKVVSKESCFSNCKLYQNACESLDATNKECSKELNLEESKSCRSVLDGLYQIERITYDSHSCDRSCFNVSNKNKMLICETSENYKDLTKNVLGSVLKSKDSFVKRFQLSKKLLNFKDPSFIENYSRLKDKIKSDSTIPQIKAVQEVSDYSLFEIWIRKGHLDCLSNKVNSYIKENEKNKGSELDITTFKNSLLSSCNISDLKFLSGETLNSYKDRLEKITYFYKGAPSGDCNYPTPRISLVYKQKAKSQVLISKKFKILEGKKYKDMMSLLNKYSNFFESGYGSDVIEILEYNNRTYVLASVISMASSYVLFELHEFGMIRTSIGDFEEPCGS